MTTSQQDQQDQQQHYVHAYLSQISRSRPLVWRTCADCGKPFQARDTRARFDTVACKQRTHRKRVAARKLSHSSDD